MSMSSSSLSDEWEEAYELLCSSTESSLSESESEYTQIYVNYLFEVTYTS